MMRKQPLHSRSRQTGSTLVISLIIMILVMILGVTSVTTSDMQFKLAGNLQFEDGALNGAETALNTAESWLSSGTNYQSTDFDDCTPTNPYLYGLGCAVAAGFDPLTSSWDDTNSFQLGSDNQRYIIELISQGSRMLGSNQAVGGRASSGCNQVNTYQVTGRGRSGRGAVKFVQSYFSVLSC